MTSTMGKPLLSRVYKIMLVQCVTVALAAIIVATLFDLKSSFACLLGGLVYILPSLAYARYLFSNISARKIGRLLGIFYLGEILKLIVSVSLFIIFYHLLRLPLYPYFAGYVIAALSFCFAPLMTMKEMMA
ncbi:MAG: ATP synthase subunit I [Gammaproteobacteria bacterium]